MAYLIQGLISPLSWVPAFALVLLLRRQAWFIRAVVAAFVTLVAGLGFALFMTPGDPGNIPALVGAIVAALLWSAVASFAIPAGRR